MTAEIFSLAGLETSVLGLGFSGCYGRLPALLLHSLFRAQLRFALRTWSTRRSLPESILRQELRAKSTA